MTPPLQPAAKPKSLLVKWFVPGIDPQSALIPSDRWIVTTVRDGLRAQKGFIPAVAKGAVAGLLGLAALGTGIAAALGAAPLAAGAAAVAGIALCGAYAYKQARALRDRILPGAVEHVKFKYAEMKMNEIKSAWAQRLQARKSAPVRKTPAVAKTPVKPAPRVAFSLKTAFAGKMKAKMKQAGKDAIASAFGSSRKPPAP
jgi:hypothetical protein